MVHIARVLTLFGCGKLQISQGTRIKFASAWESKAPISLGRLYLYLFSVHKCFMDKLTASEFSLLFVSPGLSEITK